MFIDSLFFAVSQQQNGSFWDRICGFKLIDRFWDQMSTTKGNIVNLQTNQTCAFQTFLKKLFIISRERETLTRNRRNLMEIKRTFNRKGTTDLVLNRKLTQLRMDIKRGPLNSTTFPISPAVPTHSTTIKNTNCFQFPKLTHVALVRYRSLCVYNTLHITCSFIGPALINLN